MAVLNAGAGIYAGKKARDIKDGVELADKLISDGKAMEVFEAFRNGSAH
jgi:anthranilate phosphoribosyltransferase